MLQRQGATQYTKMGKTDSNSTAATVAEKLQTLSLITRVASELGNHLGISDRTLAEFIIAKAEKLLKKCIKKSPKGHLSDAEIVPAARKFHEDLQQNGADLSFSVISHLLGIVLEMSPVLTRIVKEKEEAAIASSARLKAVEDSEDVSGIKREFPGLARPNQSTVQLEAGFYEHAPGKIDPKKSYRNGNDKTDTSARSGKRALSNLPAWMTEAKGKDGSIEGDLKRVKVESGEKKDIELYGIYGGKITKMMDFGIFVDLSIGGKSFEGLCHIAQVISSRQRLSHPSEAGFQRGQKVYVKVISIGTRDGKQQLSLSIKEVDQVTGKDLAPMRAQAAAQENMNRNHDGRPAVGQGRSLVQLERQIVDKQKAVHGGSKPNRMAKQLTEQELFEAQQLIRSGVLPVEQYPIFDSESGQGMLQFEETEEQTEVELADIEPSFLRGQTKRSGRDLEPVKIVKNPEGSLSRAAMQQGSLAKERRELRQAQANSLIDSIPKDLNRPWEDPLPEAGERHFAQELRSINMSSFDGAPEWKQKAQSKTLSYGIISSKSIKEQRESLPVYRLKADLIRAFEGNQVLVGKSFLKRN